MLRHAMELTAVVATGAGMHALWDVDAFKTIDGYEAWAEELEDDRDIGRHITAGHLVPINIHSDGAFCITLRSDKRVMPPLSADEERRVVVKSAPYRLRTSGRIGVGGIEYVGPIDDNVADGQLDPGEYDAIVHLMDYDDVQEERRAEHPDFVVTVGPHVANAVRTAIDTFERK